MTAHSKIGASSMYRWSACPGSVREAEKAPPSVSSRYAEEGTDAHAFAAMCLTLNHNPGKYINDDVAYDGRRMKVDREMAEAVQVYVDHIWLNRPKTQAVQIEQKFDLSDVHPGLFGTADCVIWDEKAKLLEVVDFKYGAGIPVEVKDNSQLHYYALGALLASGHPARTVRMTIVQPRCDHADGPVRSFDIDAVDLLDFKVDLKAFAVATEDPKAPLKAGSHCRFCPASGICPELRKRAQHAAKEDFQPLAPDADARKAAGQPPYDPVKLKEWLDSRESVKAWLKALDEFAYAELEAGRTIPGYKLVEKRAHRKYRNGEGEVIEALQSDPMLDVEIDDCFEPRSLKSPAQLEKLVGKPWVARFTVQESSGHALVPESDKRPAVKIATPQDDFTPVAQWQSAAPVGSGAEVAGSSPAGGADSTDDPLDLGPFKRTA